MTDAYASESYSLYRSIRKTELAEQHWNREKSCDLAKGEGILLNNDHWSVISYLRKQYLMEGLPRHARQLANNLTRHYELKGGNKFLRALFPSGPVTQGSRFANLRLPPEAIDPSHGCCY
ncbi:MAG: TusE/DsrC/DsvC family sulfur relay protein [Gammaproteobacteria bacterium]|nr:TusE/DsrC/DsvC family sulfur relay protein [Gammaproteobacteria bacterium]